MLTVNVYQTRQNKFLSFWFILVQNFAWSFDVDDMRVSYYISACEIHSSEKKHIYKICSETQNGGEKYEFG